MEIKIPSGLSQEELQDIHKKMKDVVSALAIKEVWSPDELALGMAITLGDYLRFAAMDDSLSLSKDEYADMCKKVIDIFVTDDFKRILH